MPETKEREYVLGTRDEEINRLGLQHRIWRAKALDTWRRAGITRGSRVLDVGAGPGYATMDLAEIVGDEGQVVAVERSGRFLEHARKTSQERLFRNILFQELDLMSEALNAKGMDASWCRWVACFVSSPEKLVAQIAASLKRGGVAIFHEYLDYGTWKLAPRRSAFESFVNEVMDSWRAAGGEPDIAVSLPGLLIRAGFSTKSVVPHLWTIGPGEYEWQWGAAFVESGLRRLLELGRVSSQWVDSVKKEFTEAEADPSTIMITPLVGEIIAERI